MKTIQLIFIVMAVVVCITVMPVTARGSTIKLPTSQWKDTTSLVRMYAATTTTPVSVLTPAYNEKDNGQTISSARNSVVKVQLNENPTTGFSWNVTTSPGIQVLSSAYVSSAPGRFGAGGLHTWLLKMTGTGTQQFAGIYRQPWMPASDRDSKYILTFNIH
jgi:inhibitor of cysteine peptidase